MKTRLPGLHGFTLIELLIVVAIAAVLIALIASSIRGVASASGLTASSEELVAQIQLARQQAVSYNRSVAIRFWLESDDSISSYQIWELADSAFPNSWRPVFRDVRLMSPVRVSRNPSFSSLLFREPLGVAPDGRRYRQFFFTPAGDVVAEADRNTITLVMETHQGPEQTQLPPNYSVIAIQPLHGIPVLYRP